MRGRLLCGVAIAAQLSGDVWAQETEEVLVTANRPTSVGKLDAPLRDQPQNVTVVVRDTLDTLGAPRLEDLQYLTVGVQAVAPALGVFNNGFFIRGFNGAPVITDGYYANSGFDGSYSMQDLSTVESIEILRGPAALLYGQGNPGGIVNLTTKQPHQQFGIGVEANWSDIGKRRLSADVTGPIGETGIGFRMQGVVEDSDTFRDFVSNERLLLAPAIAAQIGDRVDLRFKLHSRTDREPAHRTQSGGAVAAENANHHPRGPCTSRFSDHRRMDGARGILRPLVPLRRQLGGGLFRRPHSWHDVGRTVLRLVPRL
jgi:outer membrane receptor protein involved in Fe transport